jgi:glutamyl-tRNA reductase
MIQPFVFGINHHHTNALERGKFVLTDAQIENFFEQLKAEGSTFCILINTCNRTEIIGYGNKDVAPKIYFEKTNLDDSFSVNTFIKTGHDAIIHLFRLAAGLDSQIIGDLEILGQLKKAFHDAKKKKLVNGYLERMLNFSIQCAKEIRSKTKLSKGTVSISYATIKFIKTELKDHPHRILLIGTGDFGKKIAKNIVDYLPNASLSITNRTQQKANQLAEKLKLRSFDFQTIEEELIQHNIVITTVSKAQEYIINTSIFEKFSNKILIDLSIPFAIDPKVRDWGNKLFNVDEISQETKKTLETRKGEIPKANLILDKYFQDFLEWEKLFLQSETIQLWKTYLTEHRKNCSICCSNLGSFSEENLKKYTSKFVVFLKDQSSAISNSTAVFELFMKDQSLLFPCLTQNKFELAIFENSNYES